MGQNRKSMLAALCLVLALPLCAQKQQREPLTEKQIDQIAEAGIDPNARVTLYTKFLGEHLDTIKGLAKRAGSETRSRKLAGELNDFTALLDELDENLDTYAERKADLRKSLKMLSDALPLWLQELKALAGEPGFDLDSKEATESAQDLADDAKRLLTEQTDYFNLHKDEAGQDRWEPK